MNDYSEILQKILSEYTKTLDASKTAQAIGAKIQRGAATQAEAYSFARESARALNKSLKKHLPEALTDGKLYREAADVVLKQPMKTSGAQVADVAAEIQEILNMEADIGIRGIAPGLNEDQIDGIVTGICNAENYESGANNLFTQVENFLEGTVDDCARENAEFQYQSGLSPKIERIADAKCCSWCSALAGVYEYENVSNRGNDVFRRHKNCHCQVRFNPGDGSKKRQNVYSKQWTESRIPDKINEPDMVNVQSGATSGAKKTEGWEERHAKRYYEQIRNRAPYSDASKIVKHVDGFTVDEIEEIRQHMFLREVKRDGTIARFDADYDQAEAWQRLVNGNTWDTDQLMLEHERMESNIMKSTGCDYETAHDQTQQVFDWWSPFQEEKARRGK